MGIKKKSSKKSSLGKKAVSTAKGLLGGSKGKGGKSRKKSAQWYAKEILRLRLKKKYEKTKIGMYR